MSSEIKNDCDVIYILKKKGNEMLNSVRTCLLAGVSILAAIPAVAQTHDAAGAQRRAHGQAREQRAGSRGQRGDHHVQQPGRSVGG